MPSEGSARGSALLLRFMLTSTDWSTPSGRWLGRRLLAGVACYEQAELRVSPIGLFFLFANLAVACVAGATMLQKLSYP